MGLWTMKPHIYPYMASVWLFFSALVVGGPNRFWASQPHFTPPGARSLRSVSPVGWKWWHSSVPCKAGMWRDHYEDGSKMRKWINKMVTIVLQLNLRIRSRILALHPRPIGKESKHWTGVFSSHLWNQCHQVSLGTSWCQARMEPFSGGLQFCPRDPFCEEKSPYIHVCMCICVYIYGVFHKWGYPQMDGFCWKIPI